MSMSVNLHRVKTMRAVSANGAEWLHVEDDSGNFANLFMPYETAERVAEAFLPPASVMAIDAADIVEAAE